MKKILLILAALLITSGDVSAILFNLREGKPGFWIVNIVDIDVHIAPEVAKKLNKSPALQKKIMADARRVFMATKKIMPDTYKKFVDKDYKVYFFHEPTSNGLEYIRENQEKWDRRIPRNGSMSKSIMIFRTLDFFDPPYDTFYFVHEMAHFHHIALNSHRDIQIKDYYDRVVTKNKKFKDLYAGKNRMEYFAEVSATYLMPRYLNPRRGMPHGAEELKRYSLLSYKMCESLWPSKKMNFKPERKSPPRVDDIPMPEISFDIRPKKHEETGASLLAVYKIKKLMRTGIYYEEISRHGWTTEGSAETTKRKSFEAYFKAHNRLIDFKRRFPNHNVSGIKKAVEQKIGITK